MRETVIQALDTALCYIINPYPKFNVGWTLPVIKIPDTNPINLKQHGVSFIWEYITVIPHGIIDILINPESYCFCK